MTDKTASATNILPFPGPIERARRKMMAHLFGRPINRAAAIRRALAKQRGAPLPGMFGPIAKEAK